MGHQRVARDGRQVSRLLPLVLATLLGCGLAVAAPLEQRPAPPAAVSRRPVPEGRAPLGRQGSIAGLQTSMPAPPPFVKAKRQNQARKEGPMSGSESLALAREFLDKRDGRQTLMAAPNAFSYNNRVSNINIGNSKSVNYANGGDVIKQRRLESASEGLAHASEFADHGADDHGHKSHHKATPEQKALKKKLLELAERATSAPDTEGSLLRFNALTEQFEPVVVDPNVKLYKKKLQDSIKALSSRKLPVDKLRKALQGLDDEQEALGGFEDELHDENIHRFEPNNDDRRSGLLSEFDLGGDELRLRDPGQSNEDHLQLDEQDHDQNTFHEGADQEYVDDNFHTLQEDRVVEDERPHPDDEYQHSSNYAEDMLSEQSLHERQDGYEHQDQHGHLDEYEHQDQCSHPDPYGQVQYNEHGREEHTDDLDDTASSASVNSPEPDLDLDLIVQVRETLQDRLNRVSDLLYFRPEFLNQLLNIGDEHLTPIERKFKQMVLCNSDEQFCKSDCPAEHERFGRPEISEPFDNGPTHFEYRHEHFEPPHYHRYHHIEGRKGAFLPPLAPIPPIPPMPPRTPRPPMRPVSPPADGGQHYSRHTSNVFYAQDHHESDSRGLRPSGAVAVASSGEPAGGRMSHAAAAVNNGRDNTVVQQSHTGASLDPFDQSDGLLERTSSIPIVGSPRAPPSNVNEIRRQQAAVRANFNAQTANQAAPRGSNNNMSPDVRKLAPEGDLARQRAMQQQQQQQQRQPMQFQPAGTRQQPQSQPQLQPQMQQQQQQQSQQQPRQMRY